MRFRRPVIVLLILIVCIGPVLYSTSQKSGEWSFSDLAGPTNRMLQPWGLFPIGQPSSSPSSNGSGVINSTEVLTIDTSPTPIEPGLLDPATQPNATSAQKATSLSLTLENKTFNGTLHRGSLRGQLYMWYFGNLQPHHTNWAPVNNFMQWVQRYHPNVEWLWCPNPPRPLEACGRPVKTEKAQDGTVYTFCPNDKMQAAKCAEVGAAQGLRSILVVKGRAKRGAAPPGQAEFGVLKHFHALNYSRFAIFLTTDELCTFHSSKVNAAEYIFTQYYHHRLEHVDQAKVFYLPTGVASKFPSISTNEHIPGSARKYVFNLVCSIVTNKVRQKLKLIIEKTIKPNFADLPVFEHYAYSWSGNYDNKSGYLPPQRFKEVLLDSVFTLMPSGHNPECYRMYESMEAGSIPVVAMEGIETHCVQPFFHFRTAPMVFLDTWDQLPLLLQNYTAHRERYWQQVRQVVTWYQHFQETIYGTALRLLLN